MKTVDRQVLKESAKEMRDTRVDFTAKQCRAVAAVLNATAKFFEKHPEQWVSGSTLVEANDVPDWLDGGLKPAPYDRYCAIGVWDNRPGVLPTKAFHTMQTQQAGNTYYATTIEERCAGFVVTMNDSMSCPSSVVEGLRTQAAAFTHYANHRKTGTWKQSVKFAFARNAHLLQVQQARKAKRHTR